MAKRKVTKLSDADKLSDLLELANKLGLPDGALDGDVEDEVWCEVKLQAQNINSGPLLGQLEYLFEHGTGIKRLRELIKQYAAENKA